MRGTHGCSSGRGERDFRPSGCCFLVPGLPPDCRKLQRYRGTLLSTDLLHTPASEEYDQIRYGISILLVMHVFSLSFYRETPEDDGPFCLIFILVVTHGQTRDGPLIMGRGTEQIKTYHTNQKFVPR